LGSLPPSRGQAKDELFFGMRCTRMDSTITSRYKGVWLGLALLNIAWLYWMTLRPNPEVAASLAPLTTPAARWGISFYWLIDIAGNVGVFIPLGACVALSLGTAAPGRAILWAMGGGVVLSASIELLQLGLPDRVAAWDDLMLNTLGAVIGALLVCGVQTLFKITPKGRIA